MALRIGAVAYTHYESDPRVRREAEMLAARGDDVTVYCLGARDAAGEETVRGVKLVRLRLPRYRGAQVLGYASAYSSFLAWASARLAAAHVGERFDVVHVHTMPDALVVAGLLPRLAGAKIVLDMHDLMPSLYALKFGSRGARLLKAVQAAATSVADAVLAVHEPAYELLLAAGVPATKLAIVMNAADPALFPARKAEPRADGELRVVHHGTILHRYGVDLALAAFAKAHAEEPRLRLAIYGDGDFLPALRQQADALGLGPPIVDITGRREPLEVVAAKIADAHVGLIANRDDHDDSVLPTKLLEYVSIGIPVVTTKTRTIARYFADDQVAFAPVGDVDGLARALLELARDPKRRRALAAAARRFQDEYGYEKQATLLARTMDALCAAKVVEERRRRQAQVEGVKTGKRKDQAGPRA